ncbi:acyclic terpene utilization AtuA family protein [Phreatobacter sp.]|uniref:acyclic terpene utilization AtuA family protein n=1 Tax=Phreatobacter sp. TaxID=1966341 RepID=UPI003F6FC2FD
MSADKPIRIGGAGGFWGDSTDGARQLVEQGGIDYLVFDYLAEITMALLARIRARKPELGYVPDFVDVVAPLLPQIMARGIRVISNGGGMNPPAAAAELARRANALGLTPKIAVVTGDDLLPHIDIFRARGTVEMFTGLAMPERLASANAYLGAGPIVAALAAGADIVVTGRCVDSAVTLGALMHGFGWQPTDHDRLAAGSLAGHLIECGAQVTGGIATDWHEVPGWEDMGFPVVECHADGTFLVGKPQGTGGRITPLTVAEQMLYEIGDPAAYVLPDVTCDFRAVTMVQDGPDRVRVVGARGTPPTGSLKVSATWQDGFRTIGTVTIGGRDAAAKAARAGAAILARAERLAAAAGHGPFAETSIEVLGAEATYGAEARPEAAAAREVVLKIAARHASEAPLAILTREIAPAASSMAQGLTGFFAGRPGVQPVYRGFSFLVPADSVTATVTMGDERFDVAMPEGSSAPAENTETTEIQPPVSGDEAAAARTVPLVDLAVGRSGDKGNSANIGVIARRPTDLPLIRAALTAEVVADFFRHTGVTRVERFDLPGIHALNFVLHDCLGGGGVGSLRIDPQGKAFAQMLMDCPVPVPAGFAPAPRGG